MRHIEIKGGSWPRFLYANKISFEAKYEKSNKKSYRVYYDHSRSELWEILKEAI